MDSVGKPLAKKKTYIVKPEGLSHDQKVERIEQILGGKDDGKLERDLPQHEPM